MLYSVVLVSAVQQSESAIHIHISPYRLSLLCFPPTLRIVFSLEVLNWALSPGQPDSAPCSSKQRTGVPVASGRELCLEGVSFPPRVSLLPVSWENP